MPMRKVSRVHQEFINIIHTAAEILAVKDIEFDIGYGYDDIDYFCGGIRKVKVKGMKYGGKIKMCLIVKWHPNPVDRKCFREYYRREYIFHTIIVPELLNIQNNLKIEGLKMKFPNVVLASIDHDKETIVMQGIEGLQFLDRFQKMDFEHASLVARNLAKLHALSFVLKLQHQDKFDEIKKLCENDVLYSDIENVSTTLVCYFNTSVDVVSDPIAKNKLKEFEPNVLSVLNKCTAPDKNYSTICHSDCWTNNVLFKYQGTKPVDAVLIDYQLARYASPVTDLSYFLYMSTDHEFLVKHYDSILNIYYGTLSAVLRCCNLNVEDVYPRYIFQEHLVEYSVFGLIEALISMKIITAVAEEAAEMTDMKYHFSEGLCEYVSHNQSIYVERVNGVVNDFFERGYSLDNILDK
ncbi:uncharacterized protein [Epargyreus clarus]|uniref:uncharacterized protein n=1 Tax=Epargyreus clarus TaxID=520877 RepID=UPI003C2C93B0